MTAGTIAGLLDESAGTRPDQALLRDTTGETLTVAQVATFSAAATRWLWDAGVRPGMTVAWQLPSHTSAAILMLALARAAVTQAPVLHLYRQREVRAAFDVAGADILIVDESTRQNAPAGIPVVTLPNDFHARLPKTSERPQPELDVTRSADDARWIYFTSGTTGRPKGVKHSDATLLAAARGYTSHLGLGDHPDELGTIGFPIAHIGGIVYVASALIGKFAALLVPTVVGDLPHLLARHGVTISGSSTAFYQLLLSAQLARATSSRSFRPCEC